nr:hypothetical protein [Gammaproteobacteria bacterium]
MPIRIVMSRTRYLTFGLVLALALALPGRAQCAGQGDYRLGPGDKVR